MNVSSVVEKLNLENNARELTAQDEVKIILQDLLSNEEFEHLTEKTNTNSVYTEDTYSLYTKENIYIFVPFIGNKNARIMQISFKNLMRFSPMNVFKTSI